MDIIEQLNVLPRTKVGYTYKLKMMQKHNIDYLSTEEEIIKKIETVKDKYNNKLAFLSMSVILRKASNMSTDLISEYWKNLREQNADLDSETNIINKRYGLPSLQSLYEHRDKLYADSNYKDFIINYLILATNCRNADLNLTIVKEPTDELNNFLVVDDNSVTYIRNDYKTKKTYKQKKNIITDKAFIYAVKNLKTKNLLVNKNKNDEISNATLENIGQGRMLKIILAETAIPELKTISANRGTGYDRLINFYT